MEHTQIKWNIKEWLINKLGGYNKSVWEYVEEGTTKGEPIEENDIVVLEISRIVGKVKIIGQAIGGKYYRKDKMIIGCYEYYREVKYLTNIKYNITIDGKAIEKSKEWSSIVSEDEVNRSLYYKVIGYCKQEAEAMGKNYIYDENYTGKKI